MTDSEAYYQNPIGHTLVCLWLSVAVFPAFLIQVVGRSVADFFKNIVEGLEDYDDALRSIWSNT